MLAQLPAKLTVFIPGKDERGRLGAQGAKRPTGAHFSNMLS